METLNNVKAYEESISYIHNFVRTEGRRYSQEKLFLEKFCSFIISHQINKEKRPNAIVQHQVYLAGNAFENQFSHFHHKRKKYCSTLVTFLF